MRELFIQTRHWRTENLGFVTDAHRLCVALTRACFGFVIIGRVIVCHCICHSIYVSRENGFGCMDVFKEGVAAWSDFIQWLGEKVS